MSDDAGRPGSRAGQTVGGRPAAPAPAQLFLLRLWVDDEPRSQGENGEPDEGEGQALRWHGKVQHVIRGEAHAFDGWEMMVECLEAMALRQAERAPAGAWRRSARMSRGSRTGKREASIINTGVKE